MSRIWNWLDSEQGDWWMLAGLLLGLGYITAILVGYLLERVSRRESIYRPVSYGMGINFKVDKKSADLIEAAGRAARKRENLQMSLMLKRGFFSGKQEALTAEEQALADELEEQSRYCPECGKPW